MGKLHEKLNSIFLMFHQHGCWEDHRISRSPFLGSWGALSALNVFAEGRFGGGRASWGVVMLRAGVVVKRFSLERITKLISYLYGRAVAYGFGTAEFGPMVSPMFLDREDG